MTCRQLLNTCLQLLQHLASHISALLALLTSSMILAKSLDTSFPLSLNHLLKRLCALTSTSCPCVNLQIEGSTSCRGLEQDTVMVLMQQR